MNFKIKLFKWFFRFSAEQFNIRFDYIFVNQKYRSFEKSLFFFSRNSSKFKENNDISLLPTIDIGSVCERAHLARCILNTSS